MAGIKLSRTKKYLAAILLGIVLILIYGFSFVVAIQQKIPFKIFINGVLVVLWTSFTLIFFLRYKKESASP